MRLYTYRNRRNENKYIQVKRTNCGHYYIRQYMEWTKEENGQDKVIRNYTGKSKGQYSRVTRKYILNDLLDDYELIFTCNGKIEKWF